MSWSAQRGYADAFTGTELVATTGIVEGRRLVKDAGEVARIEVAADIASAALDTTLGLLDGEPTEADFGLALDTEMRRLGAQGPSFDTIVAGGPNAGLPHHRPDERRIREGDLLVLDFGALVDGYHSDMTRTVAVGDPVRNSRSCSPSSPRPRPSGVAAVAPGVDARDVDRRLPPAHHRRRLGRRVHPRHRPRRRARSSTKPRWVNATSTDRIVAGVVVTVEPGVYRGALGGVRVEDTVLVTSDGCRPLTKTPKDLACPPSAPTTSRTG